VGCGRPEVRAAEAQSYIARLMKASAISKSLVVSLIAAPLFLLAAVASVAACFILIGDNFS